MAENRREFDEIRQQHETVREQLRVKYNLNGANANAAVISQFFVFIEFDLSLFVSVMLNVIKSDECIHCILSFV